MRVLRLLLYTAILVILQTFFIQRMWSGFYVSVYIAVVILMDLRTPKWIVLMTGFACGCLIDVLSAGAGLHAAVTGFIALCRYPVARLTIPNRVLENAGPILTKVVPWYNFISYVAFMLLIWSACFFFMESSFLHPLLSLIDIAVNVIFGTLIITFLQLPISR